MAVGRTFGILHSRFHEAWSLRLGTWLGKGNDPRYTPTTTFETFPFPDGLSPLVPAEEYADDPRSAAGGANRSPVEPLFRPLFMLRVPPRRRRGCGRPC